MAVLGIIALLYLAANAVGRHYSPALVTYVVMEALVQKAPSGMSALEVEDRFNRFLAVAPSDEKLNKTLALSNYLEKVQKLTPVEMDRLLTIDNTVEGRTP